MQYVPSQYALKILRVLKYGASFTPERLNTRTRIYNILRVEAEIVGLEAYGLIKQHSGTRKCTITSKGKELLSTYLKSR